MARLCSNRGLALNLDMHRIGKAVPGMVTCRDFADFATGIAVAAQYPQTRCAFAKAKRFGDLCGSSNCLNILCHLRNLYACKPLQLAKDGFFVRRHLGRRSRMALQQNLADVVQIRGRRWQQ